MGQKVNPRALRVGFSGTLWDSIWYKGKAYADTLHDDLKIRKFLAEKYMIPG